MGRRLRGQTHRGARQHGKRAKPTTVYRKSSGDFLLQKSRNLPSDGHKGRLMICPPRCHSINQGVVVLITVARAHPFDAHPLPQQAQNALDSDGRHCFSRTRCPKFLVDRAPGPFLSLRARPNHLATKWVWTPFRAVAARCWRPFAPSEKGWVLNISIIMHTCAWLWRKSAEQFALRVRDSEHVNEGHGACLLRLSIRHICEDVSLARHSSAVGSAVPVVPAVRSHGLAASAGGLECLFVADLTLSLMSSSSSAASSSISSLLSLSPSPLLWLRLWLWLWLWL